MRPRLVLALAPVAVLLTAPWAGEPAAASCVGPTVVADEPLVGGTVVEIGGTRFADLPCDDTGGGSAGGCEDDHEPVDPPVVPYDDVVLTLVQGGRSWELASADADDDGDLSWSVTIPAGAAPGRARLETEYGATRVRIG